MLSFDLLQNFHQLMKGFNTIRYKRNKVSDYLRMLLYMSEERNISHFEICVYFEEAEKSILLLTLGTKKYERIAG